MSTDQKCKYTLHKFISRNINSHDIDINFCDYCLLLKSLRLVASFFDIDEGVA